MAKKAARVLNQDQKDFLSVFSDLCYSKTDWQVWTDFIFCTATAIANTVETDGPTHDAREDRYMSTMRGYKEQERKRFPELLMILTNALEKNPEQDFLGEMFMALELGSHWHGQFFTPYCVCQAMAEMMIGSADKAMEPKGWVGVNDPACGAGALLIAARNAFASQKLGFREAFYTAQDIDQSAGLMCYIQLSLLGCAGYVAIADTICNPVVGPSILLPIPKPGQEYWYMPMTCDPVWQERIRMERFKLVLKSLCTSPAGTENPPVATDLPEIPQEAAGIETSEPERPTEAIPAAPSYEADESGQLRFF